MRKWMKTVALGLPVVLAVVACDQGATDPKTLDMDALRADVALVAADGMFQDLAHMQSPDVWVGLGAAPEGAPVEFEGSTSFSRTVTFYDAEGEVQDRYDPLTTASMHIVADLTRTANHTFWTAEIQRHRDMTVTGLEGEETQRTWNGTSTGDVYRSRHLEDETVHTYDMDTSATINQVVRALPRADNPYPLSGSITRMIHVIVTKDGESMERTLTATITFNGTQFATMTVDGETWQIDLAERGVKRRFKKP